jgi:DNA-binding MarR family transcriptional regulator
MDIARQLDVNAAAITHQVKLLEKDGLILRRSDPKDGRRNYISLSPKGRRVAAKVHERTHELERALSSILGEEEMRNATLVLVKLRTFVENLQ